MAKNTISMKRFRASLTKISRLAKSGYNSITSVAKQIIATVTSIASKISVVSKNAAWQGASQNSLSEDDYTSYYKDAGRAQEEFLSNSLSNLMNYKDEVIADIFTVGDALTHNTDQVYFGLAEALKREFGEIRDDFFSYGAVGGMSFANGFKQSINACMEDVKETVVSAIKDINSLISSENASASVVSNVTYSSPSYNFYSSKQTVSEQLGEARRAQAISALRRA